MKFVPCNEGAATTLHEHEFGNEPATVVFVQLVPQVGEPVPVPPYGVPSAFAG